MLSSRFSIREGAAMESMMTARQVAELLGVHENWVYDQAANGDLPSYKIGGTRRFDPGELRGWIAEHRQAERGRQAPRAAARSTSAPAAMRSRDARRDERTLESMRPKHATQSNGRKEVDAGDHAQPRLFET
jgi:excisionase family DNA binding protein